MPKKIALITGISGQDGAYLAKFLLKKNYKIIGAERRSARSNNWRLEKLNIANKVIIEDIDIKELNNLLRLFDKYQIDEVYNLAAQSFVHSSFQNPIETSQVNAIGVLNFLEIIRNKKRKIKFYQASTSEMYGKHEKISKMKILYFIQGVLMQHQKPLLITQFKITESLTIYML